MSPKKRKKKKERVVTYFAVYAGKQNVIKLSPGVGRITRGKKFEVSLEIANSLRTTKDFKVTSKVTYQPAK